MHHWMEELFDILCYIGTVMGLLIFFFWYWSGSFQQRYAEHVVQEFLDEVAAEGTITIETYEEMRQRIGNIDTSYEVEVSYVTYGLQPIYAKIPEERLKQYYMSRNFREDTVFQDYFPNVEEPSVESLRLQKETNASILAAEQEGYIALPEQGALYQIEAVREVQEVYEGEPLITLCRVRSPDGNYYVEAEPCYAKNTGRVDLQLFADGEAQYISIDVICHPRTVLCTNGHKIINTEQVLYGSRLEGKTDCPFCKLIPKEITCNISTLTRQTGEKLREEEVWIKVIYLNGTMDIVTPDSEEWQDNYDENYCGIQLVSIKYRGAETTISVISENPFCIQCGSDCNERSYKDYKAFSYCVGCLSEVSLFTGSTVEEEQRFSGKEVLAMLDEKKNIFLSYGDLVTISLLKKKRHCSFLQKEVKQNGW